MVVGELVVVSITVTTVRVGIRDVDVFSVRRDCDTIRAASNINGSHVVGVGGVDYVKLVELLARDIDVFSVRRDRDSGKRTRAVACLSDVDGGPKRVGDGVEHPEKVLGSRDIDVSPVRRDRNSQWGGVSRAWRDRDGSHH